MYVYEGIIYTGYCEESCIVEPNSIKLSMASIFFIYFIKTPEFEEMGTTYIYNDTDNIITRINA